MTFWENVSSTAIGATLGFIFSIALFYLTQRIQSSTWRKALRRSVLKELEFDGDYVQAQMDALNQTIERLGNDERQFFPVIRFSGLRTVAWGQYVTTGQVWDDLSPADVAAFDDMLWNMGPGAEQLLFAAVESWKRGESDKTTTYNALDWKRGQLKTYLELLASLRKSVGVLAK